ncbi:tRNA(Ile)-lysidine synthase [Shewanella xiamenensis]|uniref:tRNA lysidine(34) synthetase TilS n=1 Tax=Shewanella xiamenensis TaxID=332186 RepID=UPI001186F195|nr:tRNA lysidine(34) synthetase TilS [Shewanella xiamenensis]TVL23269.1 tRNA(Ile)-lysidine synthase [Shewanella xiamenensis]TVL23981.1 tRNA(Ile)-lysidine synthase [Shewanella xiamenensis]TVL29113.1 tRNA(Ile)-lysidine synthase [Shewanella xiamenensis]TVL37202.1 tRNA(Ile)-lysidine synthase [Shewanella xiamenensis]TVP04914.1 tRNA(Ile)-lysidine synthase [Shewanella xiamenensis]
MAAQDLSVHIARFLDSLPFQAGSKLVLAYSGGVDSEVLAYGLSEYAKQRPDLRYQLIYVHHGLSPNADAWAKHCQERAALYGLPVTVERVQLELGPRVSVEAAARKARYQAILAHLNPQDILLTAHHEDDQLETILLALKRGQGPKGLAAMGHIQPLSLAGKGSCLQVRPLLDISREMIEAFAKAQHLVHIDDESNQDDKYDRNFLRLEIIPRLKARWPSIASTASRSAQLCAEQQAIVETEVSERLPKLLTKAAVTEQTVLKLTELAAQPIEWQGILLRGFIESQGFSLPSYVQLQQMLQQLIHAKEDAKVHIRINDCVLRRFAGMLYLDSGETLSTVPHITARDLHQEILTLLTQASALVGDKTAPFALVTTGPRLRLPNADEVVSLRYGLAGQFRCQPHFRDKGRELKKLWQECAVPPWLRTDVGFVFYNDKLVMAFGLWVEKAFCAKGDDIGLKFDGQAIG